MKGSVEVIKVLNEALRHELSAVNQYWLHYRLLDDWGYGKLAAKTREESIEEMQHADKLVERIIFLEGMPNMQKIDPLLIGQNVEECLEADLKAELKAHALYKKARSLCREKEDFISMELFASLLGDEEHHIDFLETQLSLIEDMGIKNYCQLQAAAADEA